MKMSAEKCTDENLNQTVSKLKTYVFSLVENNNIDLDNQEFQEFIDIIHSFGIIQGVQLAEKYMNRTKVEAVSESSITQGRQS